MILQLQEPRRHQGATIFARELGLQKIELKWDALQVVQALGKEEKNWCRCGQLIDDARVMLNSLQNLKVNHVIWEGRWSNS
jgi:hypothetical protein